MDPCDTIISLSIQTEAESVKVHQGLLCGSSDFFNRAMKPEWASLRKDPNTIDLSDDPLDIVILYAQWLYSSKFPIKVAKPTDNSDAKLSEESTILYMLLAKAYVFGEKIIDITFKNAVYRKFVHVECTFSWSPGPGPTSIIYGGTTAGSPMRRLVSNMIAHNASSHQSWVGYIEGYPREALIDALKRMAEIRPRPIAYPYRTMNAKDLEEEGDKAASP